MILLSSSAYTVPNYEYKVHAGNQNGIHQKRNKARKKEKKRKKKKRKEREQKARFHSSSKADVIGQVSVFSRVGDNLSFLVVCLWLDQKSPLFFSKCRISISHSI
ncbi:hypothetical protein ASPWEDRAFT_504555 [Aspergillus wentii DTO 134E9]|uniref:Uncharacterized protein n=1 Tax=Aspergillus wentii DTO 134E9 TaxID=1073089 RepID=A0A1L9RK29_ASPWE|nr:uncharacterized protein ASPWEDRAFT_504555 [Aspergillus wentii DTO 134E9]OJJ35296.1 hypothetical protein ASPWEDRAFT_504555 [Aspergillus wentii DTO 134E9]